MRFHLFKINERKRANYRDTAALYYVRRFLHIYRKPRAITKNGETYMDEKELFSGHLEIRIVKPELRFAWRFHVGNAGSETPFDGHVTFFGSSFYWGISPGRRLAQRITETKDQKYGGRDLAFRLEEGTAWISLWVDPNTSYFYKARKKGGKRRKNWRQLSFSVNPAQWIWGRKKFTYDEVASFPTTIKMPEAEYAVVITLQKTYHGRERVPREKHIQNWGLQVEAPKGVPTHFDKSGGWKGDRTYGWGVPFKEPRLGFIEPEFIETPAAESGPYIIETRVLGRTGELHPDWQIDAEAAVTGWVYAQRARTGFREPQEQESE